MLRVSVFNNELLTYLLETETMVIFHRSESKTPVRT